MTLPKLINIYNNTIILDYKNIDDPNKKETTAIEINALSTYIFNNIFYSVNGGKIGEQNVSVKTNNAELLISNNLFFGEVKSSFSALDASKTIGNPLFTNEGFQKEKYQLKNGSPAIDKGLARLGPAIPGAGTGVFKNVPPYPTVDFYGNPIDLSNGTPNIGACNAKKGEALNTDYDNDGVQNENDECPDTPIGKKVNKAGCFFFCQVITLKLKQQVKRVKTKITDSYSFLLKPMALFIAQSTISYIRLLII